MIHKKTSFKLGLILSMSLISCFAQAGGGSAHGNGGNGPIVDGLGGQGGAIVTPPVANGGYPVVTSAQISQASGTGYRLPSPSGSGSFSEFCIGSQTSGTTTPRYENAQVQEAARILTRLSEINSEGIIEYGPIAKVYNTGSPAPGVSSDAHKFLTQLCGEFRDRPTMIAEKLRWVKNVTLLRSSAPAFDVSSDNPFQFMKSDQYQAFIELSRDAWDGKNTGQLINIPGVSNRIERKVDGFTVCETKYMISEYVLQGRRFNGRQAYSSGLNAFKSKCNSSDNDYYFDFRGDSNFKAHSPESNAMIWHSISVANACKGMSGNVSGVDCATYYARPFEHRFKAARAALASWLMRAGNDNGTVQDNYSSPQIQGIMYPVFDLASLSSMPFSYGQQGTGKRDKFFPTRMDKSDFGFNELFGSNIAAKYLRIRDAVDRHTNWYQSQYNDGLGMNRSQAYSPFVASSYDIYQSNGFLACGMTVPCRPGQDAEAQQKQWMFVFKVHKSKWFAAEDLLSGRQPDFDTMWFDETTFGIESLADSERAWDRLGTPLEGEFHSIMYLNNIRHKTGQVTKDDSL